MRDIFIYSAEMFGRGQAIRYRQSLAHCFSLLTENPRMGRRAEALGANLRRHEHRSHVIIYREESDGILIAAIVHKSVVIDLDI